MTPDVPSIEYFNHRLAECPPEFWQSQIVSLEIFTKAVLYDLVEALTRGAPPNLKDLESWLSFPADLSASEIEYTLKLYLIVAWLLADPFFLEIGLSQREVGMLLKERITPLATVLIPLQCIEENDRREELSRLTLTHLGYLPQGESAKFAADRLASLDSIERQELLLHTRRKAQHAEKVRKKLEAEEARRAAARWNRE